MVVSGPGGLFLLPAALGWTLFSFGNANAVTVTPFVRESAEAIPSRATPTGLGLARHCQQACSSHSCDHRAATEPSQKLPAGHARRRLFRQLIELLKHGSPHFRNDFSDGRGERGITLDHALCASGRAARPVVNGV